MNISTSISTARKPPDRLNPFPVVISSRLSLTPLAEEKETFHISLSLKGANLSFAVGDSIGVYGQNDPNLVDAWLRALQVDGEAPLTAPKSGEVLPLRFFLTFRANLFRLTSSFLKVLQEHVPHSAHLSMLLEKDRAQNLSVFLSEHEPLDLLRQFSGKPLPYEALCRQLAPLLPRFYSIASSPSSHPEQIDLTVAHLRFSHRGEERFGVASHFLCHLAKLQETPIPIYLQPSPHFILPSDSSVPIIMIGPGTGVAPFRGFMQERVEKCSTGKHWLFFGERHEKTHFFYEEYWKELEENGLLRLTTAFSRDQAEKIYVQHRMLRYSRDLWRWVQDGAHIYVCGDAEKMAKQVEANWLKIFEQEGGLPPGEAKALLLSLRKQKRYLADIY